MGYHVRYVAPNNQADVIHGGDGCNVSNKEALMPCGNLPFTSGWSPPNDPNAASVLSYMKLVEIAGGPHPYYDGNSDPADVSGYFYCRYNDTYILTLYTSTSSTYSGPYPPVRIYVAASTGGRHASSSYAGIFCKSSDQRPVNTPPATECR